MQNRALCFTVPSAPSNPACSAPEVSVGAGSRPGPPHTSSRDPLSSHLPPWALRTLLQPGSPTFAVPGLILCHHTPGLWPPAQRAVAPCRRAGGAPPNFENRGLSQSPHRSITSTIPSGGSDPKARSPACPRQHREGSRTRGPFWRQHP